MSILSSQRVSTFRDYHHVFKEWHVWRRDRAKPQMALVFCSLVFASGLKEIFLLFYPPVLYKHIAITMIVCIVPSSWVGDGDYFTTQGWRYDIDTDSRALENVWLCRKSNIGQSGQCVICALAWWCQGHFVSKFILGNEVVWPIIKTNIFSIPTGYLLCTRYCLLCWICVLYAFEWLRTKSSLLFLIRRVLSLGRNLVALSTNFSNGSQIFNVIFKMSAFWKLPVSKEG